MLLYFTAVSFFAGSAGAEITSSGFDEAKAFFNDYLQAHNKYQFPQCKQYDGKSLPAVDAGGYREKFAEALRNQYRKSLLKSLGFYHGAQDCLQDTPKFATSNEVLTQQKISVLQKTKARGRRFTTKTTSNSYEVESPFKSMDECLQIGGMLAWSYMNDYSNQRIFIAESTFLDHTFDTNLMREFLEGGNPPLAVSQVGRYQRSKLGLDFVQSMEPLSEKELEGLRIHVKSQMLDFTENQWRCREGKACGASIEECSDGTGSDYFPSFKRDVKCQNLGRRWLGEFRQYRDKALELEFAEAKSAFEREPWMGQLTKPFERETAMKDVNHALEATAELTRQSLQKIDSLPDSAIYTLARNSGYMQLALEDLVKGTSRGRATDGEMHFYCSIAQSLQNKLGRVELAKELAVTGLALGGLAICPFTSGIGCAFALGASGAAADGLDAYRLYQRGNQNYQDFVSKLRDRGVYKSCARQIKTEQVMLGASVPIGFVIGGAAKRVGAPIASFLARGGKESAKGSTTNQKEEFSFTPYLCGE